eukprot:6198893-Pleurochrysis_carterae.AAC.1
MAKIGSVDRPPPQSNAPKIWINTKFQVRVPARPGRYMLRASVLRETHRSDPPPPPPVSALLRAVARDLFLSAPMPRQPALARPDAV